MDNGLKPIVEANILFVRHSPLFSDFLFNAVLR